MLDTHLLYFQALDKIRFLSLTDKEILGEGDDATLEIQVTIINRIMLIFLNIQSHGLRTYRLIYDM